MKKILAIALVLTMLVTLLTACNTATPSASTPGSNPGKSTEKPDDGGPPPEIPEDTGTVLRIYAWNTEFQDRFNGYFLKNDEDGNPTSGLLPEGVTVEWVITPNEGNAYQDKLDTDLPRNEGSSNPIDIFLIEADYALKYIDSPYALDVIKDVGLTAADLSGQYQYTKDIVTDSSGAMRGTTWQACPGLYAYRRSIAIDLLGSDDPAVVQAAISDWDKFDNVAEQAAAKGYKMLSGFDDSYRTFANNKSAPWVNADNEIIVDPNLMRWVEQTKTYTDKGYNNKTALWASEWTRDQGPEGDVFGFFYSTWGINWTLMGNSLADPDGPQEVGNGIYGDWAVCEGPMNYYWGGTWICAAAGSDNLNLVRQVMKTLTCDADTMKQITLDTLDYTNNKAGMDAIAADPSYGSDFLSGQNHIAMFNLSAPGIDMSMASPYDQGLTEGFQRAFSDYFNGTIDLDTALDNFYADAVVIYPELTRPG